MHGGVAVYVGVGVGVGGGECMRCVCMWCVCGCVGDVMSCIYVFVCTIV